MTTNPFIVLSHDAAVSVIQTTVGGQFANEKQLYGGFNLGTHVGDKPVNVHKNRAMLLGMIQQQNPAITRIHWLNQVHSDQVYHVTEQLDNEPVSADAHITTLENTALAIMTADCVPVMISTADGSLIAAVHAGWQGLAKGVINHTLQKMANQISVQNQDLSMAELSMIGHDWQAWIGACISQDSYEVDNRVKEAVLSGLMVDEATSAQLFRPNIDKPGHYFANLAKVAELQLQAGGITKIMQSKLDSYGDERFYSYRRQSQAKLPNTGRMATLIFRQ